MSKKDTSSHENTWGASQQAKQEWTDTNAESVRKANEDENEKRAREELQDNG